MRSPMGGIAGLSAPDRGWETVTPRGGCPTTPLRPLVLLSSLAAGGAERVAVSLARRLAQRGYPTALCTLTSRHDTHLADELRHAGVTRYDLAARRLSDSSAVFRYFRLLARAGIDVVHAHGQDAWILGSVARRLTSVPLILTRHVLDEPADSWRQSLRRRCALDAVHRADALVAPSSATADRLAQLAGICTSRIHLIPNGIDLERFHRAGGAAAREELRRALGFAANQRVVLVPALLRQGKGHDVLLDALPAIRCVVPNVTVVFAGGGEREAELRQRAEPHGPGVVFLGHRNDIPELLAGCDLVVLPSYAEALPVALIEAAAAGRPVVATHVGGTADIVEHGVTGLLVPPGDPPALAEAIAAMLNDPTRAHAFGQAGRIVARHRFSLDGHVDRTLELWSQVVTAARRRPS
jgi:glycosyltransferase involved in cell wall biosynthesis